MDKNVAFLFIVVVIFIVIKAVEGVRWANLHHPIILYSTVIATVGSVVIGWPWYKWNSIKKRKMIMKDYQERMKHDEEMRQNIKKTQALQEVKKNAAWSKIQRMDEREFEFFIAKVYEAKGYQTEVTPRVNDGGKDIILKKNGEIVAYVECKHWRAKVGVQPVRKFLGTLLIDDVKKGYFVTTSDFTQTAKIEASKQSNIILINKERLLSMIAVLDGVS